MKQDSQSIGSYCICNNAVARKALEALAQEKVLRAQSHSIELAKLYSVTKNEA